MFTVNCSSCSAQTCFCLQVSGLDETLERLDNRCNRFIKGSKKYKEGINGLSQSQTSFADFLEEFCGGTDEESMLLGTHRYLWQILFCVVPDCSDHLWVLLHVHHCFYLHPQQQLS